MSEEMVHDGTPAGILAAMGRLLREWAKQVEDEWDLDGVAEGLRRFADAILQPEGRACDVPSESEGSDAR